ncbi:hypothetical protein F3Y22_tig00117047pilonHSYRG00151 [Hibiscus syriacus]|uniref:Uncharacterized protein n=1 Tax=Hibiscus syriacus TaxID=106335 RepID=A0A6A2XDP5_HIBSY|nr:hypothetical protein F3Y22_tig00117047pilonHSYRG00151 [Hibiscus syriacus]
MPSLLHPPQRRSRTLLRRGQFCRTPRPPTNCRRSSKPKLLCGDDQNDTVPPHRDPIGHHQIPVQQNDPGFPVVRIDLKHLARIGLHHHRYPLLTSTPLRLRRLSDEVSDRIGDVSVSLEVNGYVVGGITSARGGGDGESGSEGRMERKSRRRVRREAGVGDQGLDDACIGTERIVRWFRDPTTKCWADGPSHAFWVEVGPSESMTEQGLLVHRRRRYPSVSSRARGQANVIIEKLPNSWFNYHNFIKHKKRDISLEELMTHVKIEEGLSSKDPEMRKFKQKMKPHKGANFKKLGKAKADRKRLKCYVFSITPPTRIRPGYESEVSH